MSPRTPHRQLGMPCFPGRGFALARSFGWFLHRVNGDLWACRYEPSVAPDEEDQPYKAIRYRHGTTDLPIRTRAAFADAVAGLTAGVQ